MKYIMKSHLCSCSYEVNNKNHKNRHTIIPHHIQISLLEPQLISLFYIFDFLQLEYQFPFLSREAILCAWKCAHHFWSVNADPSSKPILVSGSSPSTKMAFRNVVRNPRLQARIFLPNRFLKVVRPGKELPENVVQFHVPME